MTEFIFPKDKTGLIPPGTGPLDIGDTWTETTLVLAHVWNGYAWTVSGGSGGGGVVDELSLWEEDSGNLYPTTLSNNVGIGTNFTSKIRGHCSNR